MTLLRSHTFEFDFRGGYGRCDSGSVWSFSAVHRGRRVVSVPDLSWKIRPLHHRLALPVRGQSSASRRMPPLFTLSKTGERESWLLSFRRSGAASGKKRQMLSSSLQLLTCSKPAMLPSSFNVQMEMTTNVAPSLSSTMPLRRRKTTEDVWGQP